MTEFARKINWVAVEKAYKPVELKAKNIVGDFNRATENARALYFLNNNPVLTVERLPAVSDAEWNLALNAAGNLSLSLLGVLEEVIPTKISYFDVSRRHARYDFLPTDLGPFIMR